MPSYKGTGIRLAICETIVGKHGGSTVLESPVEVGTAFLVAIPPSGWVRPTPQRVRR